MCRRKLGRCRGVPGFYSCDSVLCAFQNAASENYAKIVEFLYKSRDVSSQLIEETFMMSDIRDLAMDLR